MIFGNLPEDMQLQIVNNWDGFRRENPEIAKSIIEQFDIVLCLKTLNKNSDGSLRLADYQMIEDLLPQFCKSQLFFESYYYPWRFRN